MAKAIKFTKMHGAGNDYIYVDTHKFPIAHPEQAAIAWSAYHTGIGSDGLVLIGPSKVADFSMRIFNADGSEAMMCGNASRCIGKYVFEKGLTDRTEVTLETLSGIKVLKLHTQGKQVESVTVDMGVPTLQNKQQLATENGEMIAGLIEVAGESYQGTFVCMGNPHFVIFTKGVEQLDLPKVGPLIEHHPLFPERVNVEFAEVRPNGEIRMRVWERGSGITMACGTGACATAVAAEVNDLRKGETRIAMDGGTLSIEWDHTSGHLFMTGPAAIAFEGEILWEE